MIRLVIGGLSAIACSLSVLLWWEVGAFAPTPPPMASPRSAAAVAAPEATPADHTNDWVANILARPLFSPDRHAPTVGATVVAGPQLVGLPRLSAVLVGPFGRSAIFAPDGGKPIIATEGTQIADWTVRAIEANAVEIVGPDGARTVHPTFGNMPGTADAAAPQRTGQSQRR
jgi:hypothetical protein